MAEETQQTSGDAEADSSEEEVTKPRLKIRMPNPIIYFFIGPFVIIFVVYIILTKLLLTSDLQHEAKLEKVLQAGAREDEHDEVNVKGTNIIEDGIEVAGDGTDGDAGFLDTHNYFQFPMAFAVNIPDTNKNLTFELAVSSFQSGVTAEWFFKNFEAFVPAIRSDVLYFMGGHSLTELQSPDFQNSLLLELRNVINAKLESLGSKPEISKVLFIRFVIT